VTVGSRDGARGAKFNISYLGYVVNVD